MTHDHLINRFLDTNGDGTGDKQGIGDFSSTSRILYFEATEYTVLKRMIVTIQDGGTFTATSYGALVTLTNGIIVSRVVAGVTTLMTDDEPVVSNYGWGVHCYDSDPETYGGGNNALLNRWSFNRDGELGLLLRAGDRLQVELQDDLSGLVKHKFKISGSLIDRLPPNARKLYS